eukprot:TRINITY_DN7595_c0_g1_i4.p1 TRINITY_DN7595_c0_g1~~TRINITY_DN7595_c0_g1_i4.p1  ORF type:complete len:620 (+),score=157.56 TRINITY_DN7595_c0_g1_i4:104-1963(+)
MSAPSSSSQGVTTAPHSEHASGPRERRSLWEVLNAWDDGTDTQTLDTFIMAWEGITGAKMDPNHPDSFFTIAGYHGQPFGGRTFVDDQFGWGGWCQHGGVLFPLWHRLYVLRLEDALRNQPGCENVAMMFWDEASVESRERGIPHILTDPTFQFKSGPRKGETIKNPICSYILPVALADPADLDPGQAGGAPVYVKPRGYETKRYPQSGLMGPKDIKKTEKHNEKYADPISNVGILNGNILHWLNEGYPIFTYNKQTEKWVRKDYTNIVGLYRACLDAPNYAVFSNTTSASNYNSANGTAVVPLEKPHNAIHLAVGGFDYPKYYRAANISFANGDMGENNTAGFDPIFFFHHCFIDYVFYRWQVKHNVLNAQTFEIETLWGGINTGGKNTNDQDIGQGPSQGQDFDEILTANSTMGPFQFPAGSGVIAKARDGIDLKALGYTYGKGSLDPYSQPPSAAAFAAAEDAPAPDTVIKVTGINKAQVTGSFVIAVYATIDGEEELVGFEPVLSRWDPQYCANCQTHVEASSYIAVPHDLAKRTLITSPVREAVASASHAVHAVVAPESAAATDEAIPIHVQVYSRQGKLDHGPVAQFSAAALRKPNGVEKIQVKIVHPRAQAK